MNRKRRSADKKNDAMQHMNVAFEVKQVESADPDFFVFEGLASTFGNIDSYNDVIAPGAFIESLSKHTPVILWQHDMWAPIGVPIEIRETSEGLFLKGKLPRSDTLVKGRVIPQIEVGSITSMSIGFRRVKSDFNEETGIRTLIKVSLIEVSLVTFPANDKAVISDFKGDTEDQVYTKEQIEALDPKERKDLLVDAGFTKEAANELLGIRDNKNDSDYDAKLVFIFKEMGRGIDNHLLVKKLRDINF